MESNKQTTAAAEWSPIFGGISVSEQIEELTKYATPFNLLAVEENKRYYVNVQKQYAVAADGDEYYRVWAQGEPNIFNFVMAVTMTVTEQTVC